MKTRDKEKAADEKESITPTSPDTIYLKIYAIPIALCLEAQSKKTWHQQNQ
jgi:hypothetical protein